MLDSTCTYCGKSQIVKLVLFLCCAYYKVKPITTKKINQSTVFVNPQLLTTFSFCFCAAMDAAVPEPVTEATEERKGESNCTVKEGHELTFLLYT